MKRSKLLIYKPEVILFVLALWVYAYFYQAGGWTQNCRFDTIRSIVEKGTHQIDNYYYNTGDWAKVNEHYYCEKPPGVAWLGVLPYYGFRVLVPMEDPDTEYLSAASYLVIVFTVAIPSALAACLVYVFLEIFAISIRFRILIALGYAFATIAFPYSTLLHGHQLVAALFITVFTFLARFKPQQAHFFSLVGMGILLGFAVSVDYSSMLGVIPICCYAFKKFSNVRQFFFLILGIMCIGLVLAIYHTICFGSPFTLAYHFSAQPFRHRGVFMGLGIPRLNVLYAILFSSYRGLFYSAPWLLIGGLGFVLASVKKRFISENLVSMAIIVGYCWLNASLADWEGGWTIGPRYLIPLLPFLSIGAAGLQFLPFRKKTILRHLALVVFILLIGYSSLMMLVATSVTPEVPISIQEPFAEFLLPAFYQGYLALNTQSIDSKFPVQGGPFVAWNLGHLIGLDGIQSLIPLGVVGIILLSWLFYISRSDSNFSEEIISAQQEREHGNKQI